MFSIKPDFIGVFKIGDNINHNLRILFFLYDQYEDANEYKKQILCKPIMITITSIIEAVLYDFYKKRISKIKDVKWEIMSRIWGKQLDRLSHYIDNAKSEDLFNQSDVFYEALHGLRKRRNRIHIQNSKGYKPDNEFKAFRTPGKITAEKVLEKIFKKMLQNHSRGSNVRGYVNNFVLPWNEHYPGISGAEDETPLCSNCKFPIPSNHYQSIIEDEESLVDSTCICCNEDLKIE